METIVGEHLLQTQTSCRRRQKVSSESVAKFLERNGWTREIAGRDEFDKAVEAVTTAHNLSRGLFISGRTGVGKTALLTRRVRRRNENA